MKNSKKSGTQDRKDLNNSNKGNLEEPITKVVDYGEIPNNTPNKSEEKK